VKASTKREASDTLEGVRVLLASILFLLPSVVVAGPKDEQPRAGGPAVASQRERALDLFEKGKAAYREGRFEEAVKLLTEAYALEPVPVLLYNLARAEEGKGAFAEAISAYERYLAAEKEIPDRGAIEQKITSLRRTIEEREALAKERDEAKRREAEKPSLVSTVNAEPEGASPWPWVVAAAGTGGTIAGAVLGGLALGRNDEAEAAASQSEAALARDEAEGLALGATVLFVVGGVVAAGGLVWGVVDVATLDGPEAGEPGKVSLSFGPTSVALSVDL
jgi:tetratricopeptide (TPR) repeat protein